MVKIIKHNLIGSTFVEALVAMVIISIAFGLTISLFSNKSLTKNLEEFNEVIQLRKIANNYSIDKEKKDYQIEEQAFLDSLCIIQKISLYNNSNHSIIKVKPINK